jgi:glycosyltransferase involved in cell wall biosynthesis
LKKVLLVTSSYAPAMPADSHRARQLAWTLRDAGWEVEVLAPGRAFQQPEWLNPAAQNLFAPDVPCHEAQPKFTQFFRLLGMNSLGWQSLLPLYLLGNRLLRSRQFDLVYITTAKFNLFCLGRFWQKKFGVPYVLDFHDPWHRPGKQRATSKHRFKFRIGMWLSRFMEKFAVSHVNGLVAVSPHYLAQLQQRYPTAPAFKNNCSAAMPFGVLPQDYSVANCHPTTPHPIRRTIVYVGVGAEIMQKSFRRIAEGLARIKKNRPDILANCRIELCGTDGGWREGGRKILEATAVAASAGQMVTEDPRIITYEAAIAKALTADGLLVLGVDDPAYMPSKLFLYALTGKPLLTCMHAQSQVNGYFQHLPELGTLIHFDGPAETEAAEDASLLEFLRQVAERKTFARENVAAEFSAAAMALKHAELFEKILAENC